MASGIRQGFSKFCTNHCLYTPAEITGEELQALQHLTTSLQAVATDMTQKFAAAKSASRAGKFASKRLKGAAIKGGKVALSMTPAGPLGAMAASYVAKKAAKAVAGSVMKEMNEGPIRLLSTDLLQAAQDSLDCFRVCCGILENKEEMAKSLAALQREVDSVLRMTVKRNATCLIEALPVVNTIFSGMNVLDIISFIVQKYPADSARRFQAFVTKLQNVNIVSRSAQGGWPSGLQQQVARLGIQHVETAGGDREQGLRAKDWLVLAIILIFQLVLQWILRMDRA